MLTKTRNLLLISIVAMAAILFTLSAFASGKNAVVTSEELACYSEGTQMVCFDGPTHGKQKCQRLDDSTVICTATNQHR